MLVGSLASEESPRQNEQEHSCNGEARARGGELRDLIEPGGRGRRVFTGRRRWRWRSRHDRHGRFGRIDDLRLASELLRYEVTPVCVMRDAPLVLILVNDTSRTSRPHKDQADHGPDETADESLNGGSRHSRARTLARAPRPDIAAGWQAPFPWSRGSASAVADRNAGRGPGA